MRFEVVMEVVSERPRKGGDIGADLSTLGENLRPLSPFALCALEAKPLLPPCCSAAPSSGRALKHVHA